MASTSAISGGSPYHTSRLCKVELGPTQIIRWYRSLLQDPLGHLLLGFRYRVTHHLYTCTKSNSVGHEGVCHESCCESDSKLEVGKLSKSEYDLRNRSTIFRAELALPIRNIGA